MSAELSVYTSAEDVASRQSASFRQIDSYYQGLGDAYIELKDRWWKPDFSSLPAYERSIEPNRKRFIEAMGGWNWPRVDLNPRAFRLGETAAYSIDRVFLRTIYGVEAYGIMLTPRGSGPFPAVICQHGFGGSPETVCGLAAESDIYHQFGARIAERGYVVFAPRVMNSSESRRLLDRKALLVGERLLGLEMFKISRLVDYLESLPHVHSGKIGIYGLSMGGTTALSAPAADVRIAASVISGNFNHRVSKMIRPSPEGRYRAYIETDEDDKFLARLLVEFSDAEVASLICPRPVFVEASTRDGAVWLEHAKLEFGRLADVYRRLGIPERAEMGIFDGVHEIHAVESLAFLDRWLKGA